MTEINRQRINRTTTSTLYKVGLSRKPKRVTVRFDGFNEKGGKNLNQIKCESVELTIYNGFSKLQPDPSGVLGIGKGEKIKYVIRTIVKSRKVVWISMAIVSSRHKAVAASLKIADCN